MPSTETESCPDCGFVWDEVLIADVPKRLVIGTSSFVDLLAHDDVIVAVRPSADRWSIAEYAGHVRDVLLTVRERIIAATIADRPTGLPIFRDERVALGYYSLDTAVDLTVELRAVSGLLVKTVQTIPAGLEVRTMNYGFPSPMERPVTWVAAQGVHELEHHLGDAAENVRLRISMLA
ncbi:MAG: DinB family protein [Actinomycetota bacterium]